MEHLVLVDGHHLMYRAYWAIPRTLSTKAGEQVNAVFGFASMMITMLKKEEPDALLICFDAGEETFRHEENATYKEGRAETPDDFYTQIPRINELVAAFGFPHASNPRYEADDLLCTYAKEGEKAGMRVTIVTGDRDALQLATKHVRIAIPHSGYQATEYLGPDEIVAKYGIRPDQVPAYKGLIGDSSDNLPGVKGIGPKTGADLISTYGTLEGVYEHLADIRPSVRAKLEADREQAFFCERMAQLVCVTPLDPPLDKLRLTDLPKNRIEQFMREMEFSMLLRRLNDLLSTPYGQRLCPDHHKMVADVFGEESDSEKDETEQLTLF